MKRITFIADENLIKQARIVGHQQGKTLNQAFREWLQQYATSTESAKEFDALMARLRHAKTRRHFTRTEKNER